MPMKQVTLNIPDNKYKFFIELINNLGFNELDNVHIPEEHKVIVRERIFRTTDPWRQRIFYMLDFQ